MKSITVEITLEADIKIEAIGFRGNACEKATAAIEAALGITSKRIKKPEFHQPLDTTQKVGGP